MSLLFQKKGNENEDHRCNRNGYSGKFGFIDHLGHFVINPQYDNAWDFKNGLAKITVGKGDDAKIGYIDKTGRTVWQPSN